MIKAQNKRQKSCFVLSLALIVLTNTPITTLMSAVAFASEVDMIQQRHRLWEKYRWPQAYESRYSKTAAYGRSVGVKVFRLDQDWDVVQVMIYLGAYQPGYIYLRYNRKKKSAHLLNLPYYSQNKQDKAIFSREEIAGLPTFEPSTGELRIYSKYRGAGGCGRYGVWRIDAERVELLQMNEQSCSQADALGEQMPLNPQAFPQIWP